MQNEDSQPSTFNPQLVWPPCPNILAPETIFLLCEPEQLAAGADEYARQIPKNDPFFIPWTDFLAQLDRKAMMRLEVSDADVEVQASACSPGRLKLELQHAELESGVPAFSSLDPFRRSANARRPASGRGATPRIFNQLHRWLRHGYAVHVICNNDGERQRFTEIWAELVGQASRLSPSEKDLGNEIRDRCDACPTFTWYTLTRFHLRRGKTRLSSPTRKFLAATKFSGPPVENPRTRWPPVPPRH